MACAQYSPQSSEQRPEQTQKKSKVVSLKLPRGKSQELWCSKKAHVQQALGVLCYGLSLALN